MIHPFTKPHHGVLASLPFHKIPYPPQVQLGPNLVCAHPSKHRPNGKQNQQIFTNPNMSNPKYVHNLPVEVLFSISAQFVDGPVRTVVPYSGHFREGYKNLLFQILTPMLSTSAKTMVDTIKVILC